MSKVQMLRFTVNQRLTAAAEEIFELFERTIAEYEEQLCRSKEENQRQQKLLEAVLNPGVHLHRADFQLVVRKDEFLSQQQEKSSSVNQEKPPEPALIKEEQEELWTKQEREPFQGADEPYCNRFTFTSAPVKNGVKAQSPHLDENQSENKYLKTEVYGEHGGSQGAERNFHPDSHLQLLPDETVHLPAFNIDVSGDWKESDEHQEGSNAQQNKEVAVGYERCNTGYPSVSFSECAPSFGQREQPQELKEIHAEENQASCTVCGKTYQSKKTLRQHMLRHSAERPFSCSFCNKGFIWRAELVTHMRVHTGEKPFSCSVCGKRFSLQGDRSKHFLIHTGEKPFSCIDCGKRFRRKGHLKIHSKIHTGEKPFSCIDCGKTFRTNPHLQKHLCSHTGVTPIS